MSSSPDASLTQDDSFTATSHRGLTYPWGDHAPGLGEMTPVADGVYWVRIPMPGGLDHINCWVIDAGDNAIATVDSGMRIAECRDAWTALFDGPLAGKTLPTVIATHLHPDHIGLVGWLCERDGGMLHMTRTEWLTAQYGMADAQDEVPEAVSALRRATGWTEEQIETSRKDGWGWMRRYVHRFPHNYRRLRDGDHLRIGATEWEVIVGNGHSPEHACLYNRAANVLIAGDQLLPRISSNVSVQANEPMANPLADWIASIDKLRAALPEDVLVLPAHGEPFRGAHARLDAIRSEHMERLEALALWCAEAPRSTVDCFPKLFNREIGDRHRGLATGEALAHLRWLEDAGRVTRDMQGDVWMWRGV